MLIRFNCLYLCCFSSVVKFYFLAFKMVYGRQFILREEFF